MEHKPSWSKMWHEFFKPVIVGSGLIILAAWVFGISFYLFPWKGGGLEWWNIPHVVTTSLLAIWPGAVGIAKYCYPKDKEEEDEEC